MQKTDEDPLSSSSDSPDEEEKERQAMLDDLNRPRATRLQWSGFGKKAKEKSLKVEELFCPFKECGRKFVSHDQLREHIDRRHKAPTKEPEPIVSTPIPAKSKVMQSETPKTSASS